MTELHPAIPENIQKHLQFVAKSFGLSEDQETVDALATSWTEKLDVFETKMIDMGMDEVGTFEKDDERGALALTYSGSLVSIGPLTEDGRKIEYTSIGLRKDVPESVKEEGCALRHDMEVEKSIEFDKGPLKRTSPIYKIVVCPLSLSAEEQENLVSEATTLIVDTFVEMNQDLF
ncbi:MAG: hypothetical protein JXB03_01225 [Spirochaetales bacterium]|nr:hypothetical protein [Spirochaetales bacterium]